MLSTELPEGDVPIPDSPAALTAPGPVGDGGDDDGEVDWISEIFDDSANELTLPVFCVYSLTILHDMTS